MKGNLHYSDKKMIEALRKKHKELGRPLTGADATKDPNMPGPNTYQIRFGSWNKALALAGIRPAKKRFYPDNEIIDTVKRFTAENGRSPKEPDFIRSDYLPGYTTAIKRFGNYSKLMIACGLPRSTSSDNQTKEHVLIVQIDFTDYSEILAELKSRALKETRSVDFQIIHTLRMAIKGWQKKKRTDTAAGA